jgi:hypothetical protein
VIPIAIVGLHSADMFEKPDLSVRERKSTFTRLPDARVPSARKSANSLRAVAGEGSGPLFARSIVNFVNPSAPRMRSLMNAPFIEFVRRFRELERENAAQSASSPPQTIILRTRTASTPAARAEMAPPDRRPASR